MPNIKVEGMRKRYQGGVQALDEVSFEVASGESVTLLGPSGCGKSTTLACIAGLESPDAGRVSLGGSCVFDAGHVDIPTEERNVGVVFQSYALWPHMSVFENLVAPLKVRRIPRPERRDLVRSWLERVGLSGLEDRLPSELSGGQQQRVGLARALIYSPEVVLLDEPLSNLDARLRDEARVWLNRIQKESGVTAIYVTHDQTEALAMSDRVVVMSEGRILQIGSPYELYRTPATAEIARSVGRVNLLSGVAEKSNGASISAALPEARNLLRGLNVGAAGIGDAILLGFRPDDVRLARSGTPATSSNNVISGCIVSKLYMGSKYEYRVACGPNELTFYDDEELEAGDVLLEISVDRTRVYLVEEDCATGASYGSDQAVRATTV